MKEVETKHIKPGIFFRQQMAGKTTSEMNKKPLPANWDWGLC